MTALPSLQSELYRADPNHPVYKSALQSIKHHVGASVVDAVDDYTLAEKLQRALVRVRSLRVTEEEAEVWVQCLWRGDYNVALDEALVNKESLFNAAKRWNLGYPAMCDPDVQAIVHSLEPRSEHSPEVQAELDAGEVIMQQEDEFGCL